MKHLESYVNEIATEIKKVSGAHNIKTLVDANAIFIAFNIRNLNVLNNIDRVIPAHYYMSIEENRVLIQYPIFKEFSEFLARNYISGKKIIS